MNRSAEGADRSSERTSTYWAVLAAALVATAAPAAFAQTSEAQPAPAPGAAVESAPEVAPVGDVVVLEADLLTDDQNTRTVTAEGDVQARHGGRTLRADRVVYNLDTGEVLASGNVQVIGDDGSATYAEEIQADEALNVGVARELRARMPPSGTLAARTAISAGEGRSELRRVIFTSCPICEDGERPPTWTLRARRAVQNTEQRVISYEGATFEVLGLPILYLPYFAHPDPGADRHSGFLTPDIGSSRRLGAYYNQPYYWAMSPSQDLTASLRVHEQVNPLIGLEYRKRFWSGELQLEGTITQDYEFNNDGDPIAGSDNSVRSSLFGQGLFSIDDYWDWGFGVERISDVNYLRRYGLDGSGERRGPYLGDYTRLISQLYAIGQDDNSYSSVSLVSFQDLRLSTGQQPLILPYIDYSHVLTDPLLGGQVNLQANTAVLQRTASGRNTARASVAATWRRDLIFGPGVIASPFAQARGDVFHNETTPDDVETFGRSLGVAGVEVSWPFMRPGEEFDLVVEPVAMGAVGSEGGDDPRIVNEDSIGFELDDSNLFRFNAVSNYDLWEPGSRLSLGVRATARRHNGQMARAFLGRRWRDEAVPSFTVQNNMEGRASDWVGAVEADLGRNFGTEVRFRLEDETLELQRLDASIRARAGRFRANARYYQLAETLAPGNPTEEIAGTVAAEIAGGWSAQFGLRRDLDLNINLRQEISAIYTDDCTFLEITYTRTETFSGELGPDQGFMIRIGLTSLGMVGGGN